jgi:carbamoyl-phosphate synthase large subunit
MTQVFEVAAWMATWWIGSAENGAIQLAVYTAAGAPAVLDEQSIRRSALTYRGTCITTMGGARAAVDAIAARVRDPIRVWRLQEIPAKTVV